MEQWIKIDEQYSVSSYGNVRNNKKGKMLKPYLNNSGYFCISLYGKRINIHRLMIPFLDNPNQYECVDHIDRNRQNNYISNLRMVSYSQNNRNVTKKQNTLSQYKGVSFDKKNQKWIVAIRINKKAKALGRFNTELEAAKAYNKFCIENNLTTANLNIL